MIDDNAYFELLSYLHDELTPEEAARIEQQIKEDAALASQLLILAEDEARIVEWARSGEELGPATGRRETASARRSLKSVALLLALAASLLVLAGPGILWRRGVDRVASDPPGTDAVAGSRAIDDGDRHVAQVEFQSGNCQWFIENRIWESNKFVYPKETLHLVRGQLDLAFVNQTRISLSAPAVLEVESPMLTRLRRGSVNVEVGEGAEGFEVLTPLTRVVDLGTRFGLSVDDAGLTDVVVFEGAVVVEAGYDDQASKPLMQRLDAGEGVRFDHQGTMSRVVTVAKDRFPARGRDATENPPPGQPIVVSEVWDNIKRGDSYKFYEIVPAGLREDAKAFVDRVYYEWNGVDARGLPEYLVGSDYVKTFNSDKLNSGIVIALRIERPATLYVLIDNRIPIPDWVRRDYEDTGDDIGIDEGFDKRAPHLTTDVGPGRSIDNVCSIWMRPIAEPGVVELGAIEELAPGPNPSHISMYGIAVAPLK